MKLQDGRLASGGDDGSIIIYNKQSFTPELTIKEHKDGIYNIIQLKNGNLLSCSRDEQTMKEYKINESNTYKVLSTVNFIDYNYPRQIVELEDNKIGLVAYNCIIFYLNINNNLNKDFSIVYNYETGEYFEMILVKPGELAILGVKIKFNFLK